MLPYKIHLSCVAMLNLSNPDEFCSELVSLIEAELQRRDVTESSFSRKIVGHDALIKNLRKGSMPSPERLSKILEELGISMVLGAKNTGSEQADPPDLEALLVGSEPIRELLPPRATGEPSLLTGDVPEGRFVFRTRFHVNDRLRQGWIALVDPDVAVEDGDLIFCSDDAARIFILQKRDDLRHGYAILDGTNARELTDKLAARARLTPITWTGRTPLKSVSSASYPTLPNGLHLDRSRHDRISDLIEEIRAEAADQGERLSQIDIVSRTIAALRMNDEEEGESH